MADNPLEAICTTIGRISASVQSNLSKLISIPQNPTAPTNLQVSLSTSAPPTSTASAGSYLPQPTDPHTKAGPVTREELGRATWTFIHTLGAQMAIISRIYPCKECADHFKEVLRSNPVQAGSQAEFSQWLCRVHNVVNRSLGKPTFPCERVDARWGKLDCEHRMCDLQGSMTPFD
ncbi:FAD-linked sulfhydryl oxidase ERV1 isoform X4 [Helianthus annuus]|uniref:thiol oxidase isoform 4 n=1 Tax=Helianthus annuus TaxID=4232 RepID=UPI000B8F8E3C|nr:thiol oxidase isoform 4 [Helianthus annuus]